MKKNLAVCSILAVFLATPALAGKTLSTPALDVPTGGKASCTLTNVGTKNIAYGVALYEYDGTALVNIGPDLLMVPHQAIKTVPVSATVASCVLTLSSGSTKSARLAIQILNSSGEPVDSAEGR